ncbi:hypothetical protein [Dokdonia sp. 4H-3-7-5]|uniref:hypothetical protein n=1 Tax=Dokdonia sp. (strain 4H-3-7-5) TaxID=983548 RepID=UPI00020A60A5|nr:hypothetical protein [Dokdonia sp. 4H-3-7-5]AEE18305.1 hypothetical protein Krodi_0319 [Dokdonia sp. 4H-3-7-5]
MDAILSHKLDAYRRLFIEKDLIELSQWIDAIESINLEIDYLQLIEKRLIKNSTLSAMLQGFRRKNTLVMASLCKYEQELKREYEYSARAYDTVRAKEHEGRRVLYSNLMIEFKQLRKVIYMALSRYKRS